MCFSIPYKVTKVTGNRALLEHGKVVTLGNDEKVKAGSYVQMTGNLIAGILSPKEGKQIQKLIKELNTSYET